jgi:ribosomal-protein-serine acetyltransferase
VNIIFTVDVDENIKLKLLNNKDKLDFFELINKNRDYLELSMPRIRENKSIADTEKVINIFLCQLVDNNGFRSGIFYKGQLIGIIGLKYIDWVNKKTEIMYWVDKDFSGKGIATKCTKVVLDIAFNYYELNKAILRISVENKASMKIAERCNFILEGICKGEELLTNGFTDVYVYGILKSYFEESKK